MNILKSAYWTYGYHLCACIPACSLINNSFEQNTQITDRIFGHFNQFPGVSMTGKLVSKSPGFPGGVGTLIFGFLHLIPIESRLSLLV